MAVLSINRKITKYGSIFDIFYVSVNPDKCSHKKNKIYTRILVYLIQSVTEISTTNFSMFIKNMHMVKNTDT